MPAIAFAEQFLLDAEGKRVGVIMDIKTYERLVEAAEDQRDAEAYGRVAEEAARDLAAGECINVEQMRVELRAKTEAAP